MTRYMVGAPVIAAPPKSYVCPPSQTVTFTQGDTSRVGPSAAWLAALERSAEGRRVVRTGPGLLTYVVLG